VLSFKKTINFIHKERSTLQVHPFITLNSISDHLFSKRRKVSFFASFVRRIFRKRAGAFLTVEATIVLPIFVFVMCAFFWFFVVFKVQMELQGALCVVSKDLSEYAFLYEEVRNFNNEGAEHIRLQDGGIERWLVGGITEAYVESEIKKIVGEDKGIWRFIEDGKAGIELKSFLRIPDEDGMIDLILVYEMRNPFLPKLIGNTEYVQRSRVRAWTGFSYKEEGKEEDKVDVVYVTEYGSVYHTARTCTYLNLSILSFRYTDTNVLYKGNIYTECDICDIIDSADKLTVYITETGTKFHWTLSCRSLKRTIYEIPKAEAAEYAPCSRCGKDEE